MKRASGPSTEAYLVGQETFEPLCVKVPVFTAGQALSASGCATALTAGEVLNDSGFAAV